VLGPCCSNAMAQLAWGQLVICEVDRRAGALAGSNARALFGAENGCGPGSAPPCCGQECPRAVTVAAAVRGWGPAPRSSQPSSGSPGSAGHYHAGKPGDTYKGNTGGIQGAYRGLTGGLQGVSALLGCYCGCAWGDVRDFGPVPTYRRAAGAPCGPDDGRLRLPARAGATRLVGRRPRAGSEAVSGIPGGF
jgi:hypothetical protein